MHSHLTTVAKDDLVRIYRMVLPADRTGRQGVVPHAAAFGLTAGWTWLKKTRCWLAPSNTNSGGIKQGCYFLQPGMTRSEIEANCGKLLNLQRVVSLSESASRLRVLEALRAADLGHSFY